LCERENRKGGHRLLRQREGDCQGGVSPPAAYPHQEGAARPLAGRRRIHLKEGSTSSLGVEACGQPRPRPPSCRLAKARRSGGSLACGVEGQMDRAKRIHLGGRSDGAIPPPTDSTRRVAVEEANV